tara:strand:- start:61709 stop:62068 length:360 start_codon:yes stop_codon:yes gene_type:complete
VFHVRQVKGRKDRYVPLGNLLIKGLEEYILCKNPVKWLFNGNSPKAEKISLSGHGVYWIFKEAHKKRGVLKPITAHTIRHSYATHLLEMGLDIISLKEVFVHSCIETTMLYLHVNQLAR